MAKFLKLAAMQIGRAISDTAGKPTKEFVRYFNDMKSNIEASINTLATQQADILTSLENAGIAIITANAANAMATANARESALVTSYVDPGAILSAAISPADATKAKITISAHTRRYGDGTSATVSAGSFDLLDLETVYYVFYNDAARTGGAVTYQNSQNYLDAAQTGNRHSVGSVLTPTLGGSTEYGGGVRPQGTGGYREQEMFP